MKKEKNNFKRLVTLMIAATMFLVLLPPVSADCPIGMVSYWKLDEGSGTTADDSAGTYDGTLKDAVTDNSDGNTPPQWVNGISGKALEFDGVDDYVDCGDIDSMDGASKLSISLWMYANALSDYDGLVEKYSVNTARTGILLSGSPWGENDDLHFQLCNGATTALYTIGNYISTGNWYHIVMVFDGTQSGNENRLKAYINGDQKTGDYTGTIPATTADTSASFTIGRDIHASGRYFDGIIDEVAIYDRVLTDDEIYMHYCLGQFELGYCDDLPTLEYTGTPLLYDNTESINLEATLTDATGTTPMQGYNVYFYIDESTTPVGNDLTDVNGIASIDLGTKPAGVYKVIAKVHCIESDAVFIVVYDPSAGFVTGGGWIDSPAGAYQPDTDLTGKANFGFVSKYKKGQTIPTGNTEFQFKAGDLNFHSTEYEWLVIAGCHAKYKGNGTINGEGNFGFMLTATDGQINGGGGVDKVRIKIWDKNDGDAIVYDNKIDDNDYGTELDGGQIKIHQG